MQERVPAYVQTLTVKGKSGYELAARVCSSYFDGRGIDYPAASDWDAFKEYYRQEYQREKGKALSETTLQQNFVARGKAFYRWCMEQDTPPLIETDKHPQAPKPANTEDIRAPIIKAERHSDTSKSDTDKPTTRLSFLLDTEIYRVLAVLSALEDKTMTEILTAGAQLYIREHSREAEIARGAIAQVKKN